MAEYITLLYLPLTPIYSLAARAVIFSKAAAMARWPDERKANVIAIALVFALFPLLCWLSWRWLTE